MGFGTLFIGYFFLINITYFSYTDAIAAMVMLTGLYRLSTVNRDFRRAMIASAVFALIAIGELALAFTGFFVYSDTLTMINSYLGAIRYAAIFVLSVFIMRGIYEVAREVEADDLASTAKRSLPISFSLAFAALTELPFLSVLIGKPMAYVYFIVLTAVVFFVVSALITIYRAYASICMPEDLERERKKTKQNALTKFYDSLEESGKKYAEYRRERKSAKNSKRKK
ncbi:MAG: hypothetical protein E7617_01210 [Ruminococcaceae bacterium]|nr:hypothetical protein [Oscillospiraceae bacterium]